MDINNYKHLSLDQRIRIRTGINNHEMLKDIAAAIGKDPRTVSREIRRHREDVSNYHLFNRPYSCQNFATCEIRLAGGCNVNQCSNFKRKVCTQITEFPYVCGDCPKHRNCHCQRYQYNPKYSQKQYEDTLSMSRQHSSITQEDIYYMNKVLTPLIAKGEPLVHIYMNNIELQKICSLRYLYMLIDSGILDVRNIDLRRKVSYKARKKTKKQVERANRVGRTYQDYLNVKDSCSVHMQMDTVIGTKEDEKVILTLLIPETNFMFGRILKHKRATAVVSAFNDIEDLIGINAFKKIFKCTLTDNGTEFALVDYLEANESTGEIRCNIYFCDSRQSQQKGAIEKNHEYIRYILPKGTSFQDLNQHKLNRIMSHINSTYRASLNSSPYKATVALLGENIVKKLGVTYIPANCINLTPNLLKD